MLDTILALELTVLGDLTDEDHHAVILLRPVGECLCAAEGRHRIGTASFDSNIVVEGLKRIMKDEELLIWVGLAEHLSMGEECG